MSKFCVGNRIEIKHKCLSNIYASNHGAVFYFVRILDWEFQILCLGIPVKGNYELQCLRAHPEILDKHSLVYKD